MGAGSSIITACLTPTSDRRRALSEQSGGIERPLLAAGDKQGCQSVLLSQFGAPGDPPGGDDVHPLPAVTGTFCLSAASTSAMFRAHWWNRFGPMFAAHIRRQRIIRMRGFRQWRWQLDDLRINPVPMIQSSSCLGICIAETDNALRRCSSIPVLRFSPSRKTRHALPVRQAVLDPPHAVISTQSPGFSRTASRVYPPPQCDQDR